MTKDVVQILRSRGIQPSAQRVAVAQYVLHTDEHPCAEQVFARVRAGFPMLSRATVYNTLHLLVDKGLLRELALSEGRVIFDPRTEPHHHLLDEETGAIHDIPWEALQVSRVEELAGFEIKEYQVVLRGRAKGKDPARG